MTLGPDVNTVLDQRRSIRTYHDLGTTMNQVMDECVRPLIACHDVMVILTGQSPKSKCRYDVAVHHYFILNSVNVGLLPVRDKHADKP